MGLCIFDIDDLFFCLKFPVLQGERHVAVLGIVVGIGDADTVAVVPSGSAGAGNSIANGRINHYGHRAIALQSIGQTIVYTRLCS